jgi:hypothetical protein
MMVSSLALAFALTVSQADGPARIAGRVIVEGTGAPISGARVMLLPSMPHSGPFGPPAQAISDRDGVFVFENVGAGDYRLDAQKTGYVGHTFESGPPPRIHVVAGQALDGVVVAMKRGAVITGRVLDPAGEPLPDISVMALRRLNRRQGELGNLVPGPGAGQQTNDIGEFRIAGLPPGEYFVAASPRPAFPLGATGLTPATQIAAPSAQSTTLATTYFPGTTDQLAARPVAIQAGETINGIEITMQVTQAFRVSGRVVDENNAPVEGAMVMMFRESPSAPGPAGSARSRSDGRFTIPAVPAGTYRLNASSPVMMRPGSGDNGRGGGLSASVWSSSGGVTTMRSPQPVSVVVSDQDVAGVRLVVRRAQ